MPTPSGATPPDATQLRAVLNGLRAALAATDETAFESLRHRVSLLLRKLGDEASTNQVLDPDMVVLVSADATQFLDSLSRKPWPHPLTQEMSGRLASSTAQLEAALPEPVPQPLVSSAPIDAVGLAGREQVEAVVVEYQADALREQHASQLHTLLAIVLAAASAATAIWGVRVVATATEEEIPVWPGLSGPLAVTCILGVLAIVELRAAASARRSSRESVRLQRGLASLDGYLAPLPVAARNLLRATMTQSFFPPLLEDHDPLRQPQWPDTTLLAQSIYEYPEDEGEAEQVDEPEIAGVATEPG